MLIVTFAAKNTPLNRKIKVSAVSYLNTKPLLYGIERSTLIDDIELTLNYPAIIAQALRDGTVDLGLVPVAAIPTIPNARVVSDYGLAADGKVASVCIFSKVPMDKIERVYLDYQSRTSVQLAQILLEHHWLKQVEFIPATENYIASIEGTTAGVIIGDRALEQLPNFEYIYDLAEAWKAFTGLPFVFAAWVANKDLPTDFIAQFNKANEIGLDNLTEIITQNPYPAYDLNVYYKENIQYFIDEEKIKGLALFLEYLNKKAATTAQ